MTTSHAPPVFATWYRDEFPKVARALALATGDPLLGEEAAAEAFVRALTNWKRVGAMASPGGWVYMVAPNEVRRTWRRAALERRATERLRIAELPPQEPPDDTLWRAVAALPPRARTAIALRYVADLSEAQIADAMNITRGAVSATLSNARKQLAAVLDTTIAKEDR